MRVKSEKKTNMLEKMEGKNGLLFILFSRWFAMFCRDFQLTCWQILGWLRIHTASAKAPSFVLTCGHEALTAGKECKLTIEPGSINSLLWARTFESSVLWLLLPRLLQRAAKSSNLECEK